MCVCTLLISESSLQPAMHIQVGPRYEPSPKGLGPPRPRDAGFAPKNVNSDTKKGRKKNTTMIKILTNHLTDQNMGFVNTTII